jgi:cytochrome c
MRKGFMSLAGFAILLTLPLIARQKGDVDKGKSVFEKCAICHNAETDEKKVGPSLHGLFQHKKLKNGKPVTEENVLAQINQGGGGMPPFADTLSQEEKDNLLAYLHTL